MADKDSPRSLDDLDARLKEARRELEPKAQDEARAGAASVGYRIGVEIIAGVIGGAGVGWLLDTWLNTRPWFMVVLLFMGFAAGLVNAFRTGKRYAAMSDASPKGPKER